jgi:bacteriorhodopsin
MIGIMIILGILCLIILGLPINELNKKGELSVDSFVVRFIGFVVLVVILWFCYYIIKYISNIIGSR